MVISCYFCNTVQPSALIGTHKSAWMFEKVLKVDIFKRILDKHPLIQYGSAVHGMPFSRHISSFQMIS